MTFVILINQANAPIRKERFSRTSKARRGASRNNLAKKGGVPDIIESFVEVDSSDNRPRDRPEFVKPIQNGLRKKQNLIKCTPSKAEIGLVGKENRIRLQKEK